MQTRTKIKKIHKKTTCVPRILYRCISKFVYSKLIFFFATSKSCSVRKKRMLKLHNCSGKWNFRRVEIQFDYAPVVSVLSKLNVSIERALNQNAYNKLSDRMDQIGRSVISCTTLCAFECCWLFIFVCSHWKSASFFLFNMPPLSHVLWFLFDCK